MVLTLALLCCVALPDMPTPKISSGSPAISHLSPEPYWTKGIRRVYFVEATGMALDTAITCRNLSQGGRELNLPINNCAEMLGFQVGEHLLGYALSRAIWKLTPNRKLAMLPQIGLIYGNFSGATYSLVHR